MSYRFSFISYRNANNNIILIILAKSKQSHMHHLASNLKYLRKSKGLTQAQLAEKLGLKRPIVGAYEEGRSEPKLATLLHLAHFFEVNIDALVSVDVSDPVAMQSGHIPDTIGKSLRILPIAVDRDTDRELSTLVPVKASAGYLNGYGDVDFIERLPRFDLPFPELAGDRSYRVFQTKGDSMLPIPSGAYMICTYVQDWSDVRNDECYVLVTRSEGVVYKRVINELQKGYFRLKSDNTEYDTYDVPAHDVVEVWKAIGFTSFQLPEGGTSVDALQMAAALRQIQSDISDIKNKI